MLRWLLELLCRHDYVDPEGRALKVRSWGDDLSRKGLVPIGVMYVHGVHELRDGSCMRCGKLRLDATQHKAAGERTRLKLAALNGGSPNHGALSEFNPRDDAGMMG